MATLVNKTIKASGGDYTSLKALSDADADLVAADEAWVVTCDNIDDADSGAVFSNWVTDATRYLKIVAATAHGSRGTITTAAYRRTVDVSTFATFGNGGLIILQGLQLSSVTGAGGAGNVGTVRMIDCVVRRTAAGSPILMNAGATATTFECINCIVVAEAYAAALGAVYQEYGIFKAYHSAFIHLAASGWGVRGAHTSLGSCTLKNCYAYGVAGALKDPSWYTLTTVGTSDASSTTVALRNLALDSTNFTDEEAATLDLRLPAGSALIGVGTDISGESAPWNVLTDIEGNARSVPYDIGPSQYNAPIVSSRRRNSFFVFGGI